MWQSYFNHHHVNTSRHNIYINRIMKFMLIWPRRRTTMNWFLWPRRTLCPAGRPPAREIWSSSGKILATISGCSLKKLQTFWIFRNSVAECFKNATVYSNKSRLRRRAIFLTCSLALSVPKLQALNQRIGLANHRPKLDEWEFYLPEPTTSPGS